MGQAVRPRTLGDKLFFLRQLSPEDLRAIETLVDHRIELLMKEEYERSISYSKPLKVGGMSMVNRR